MMVKLQGGDVSYIEDTSKFRKASFSREVYAPADGYITHMDSEKIGLTAVLLGAGREKKDDDINHAAGIIIAAKTGDFVKRGELLATLLRTTRAASTVPSRAIFSLFQSAIRSLRSSR